MSLLILYQALVRHSSFEWVDGRLVKGARLFSHFDYDFCRRIVTLSAIACSVVLITTVSVLLLIGPSYGKCVDWAIAQADGRATTNVWLIVVFFCAAPAAVMIYHALRWDHMYRKLVDRVLLPEKEPYEGMLANVFTPNLNKRDFDYNHMFVMLGTGWALFCAAPLCIIFFSCRQGL